MSMTRGEAIALLNEQYETCKRIYDCSADQRKSYPNVPQFMEALGMALTALRPFSREQVEKVWRGEWMGSADGYADGELVYDTWECSHCGYVIDEEDDPDMLPQFCPKCYAAMTEKAVDMVMEKMEALHGET